MLIFIYDTPSYIAAMPLGPGVNNGIGIKPFIKVGLTLQWLPCFPPLLSWKLRGGEIKHEPAPGSTRDKNLFSIIAPLLLEGRQAKGNGGACDKFMAEPLRRSTRGWGITGWESSRLLELQLQ